MTFQMRKRNQRFVCIVFPPLKCQGLPIFQLTVECPQIQLVVVHNCHNFQERTQPMLGSRRSRAIIRFSKMSFMVRCDFEKGSKKIHFHCTLLVCREGGDYKKEYPVY